MYEAKPPLRSPAVHVLMPHTVASGELGRYAVVGALNTVFGYAAFVVFQFIIGSRYGEFGYMLAAGASSLLSITVSFLGYKWFVFKTKGHYFREWLLCMLVYGSTILMGLALFPVFVLIVKRIFHMNTGAPYLAAALVTCVNGGFGFVLNRRLTFMRAESTRDET